MGQITVNKTSPSTVPEPTTTEPLQPAEAVKTPPNAATAAVPAKNDKANIAAVIVVAVLIAAGLIALGFYAYSSKNDVQIQPDGSNATTEDGTVDETTLDAEASELDDAASDLNNDSDFDQSQINDENLGL